jgi:hypothetical protein
MDELKLIHSKAEDPQGTSISDQSMDEETSKTSSSKGTRLRWGSAKSKKASKPFYLKAKGPKKP